MIAIRHKGSFKRISTSLDKMAALKITAILDKYGAKGVSALSSVTPKDSGETANSWSYSVTVTKKGYAINWSNSNNTPDGIPIVILLQYGHATKDGGYIKGIDFINPAMKPILQEISADIWKEITQK